MSRRLNGRRPWASLEAPPHDDLWCGFLYDESCDECRMGLWPERFFRLAPEPRCHHPQTKPLFLSQYELIRSLHHFRNKPAVMAAVMELILPDLVKVIDQRIAAWRRK